MVTRLLFVAANPRDTQRLDLDREVDRIKDRLRESSLRDMFDIEQEWAVQLDELARFLLDYQPHIVHFSGHGSSAGELVFEDAAGTGSTRASQEAIADLFRILRDHIRVVVLNACYSEKQARAIARHIDCVIGTSTSIGDLAAIDFAGGFYRALGFKRDVKTAFELGCNEIQTGAQPGHRSTPQLIVREGVDANSVIPYSDEESPPITHPKTTSVGEEAEIMAAEVGDVTGVSRKGKTSATQIENVEVLKRAKIGEGATVGDIVGVVEEPTVEE